MNLARVALKFYAPMAWSFENASKDPRKTQEEVLSRYLSRNKDTEYGRRYGFASIRTIEDYRNRVPLTDCETMRSYIDRLARGEPNILTKDRPIFFGATSGTTSTPKLIPTTRFSERINSSLMDLWSYYIARDHPDVLSGKILTIVSPEVEGRTPSGIAYGGESGRAYKNLPLTVKHMYALPYETFEIPDYESRYYTILRISMARDITDIATINPNSLILLCHKIEKWRESIIDDIERGSLSGNLDIPDVIRRKISKILRPDPKRAGELRMILQKTGTLLPRHFWPNLEIIECWKGGTVNVYLKELPVYFGNVAVRDLGCHSTEARSSIPISDEGAGGVLAIQTNFYEFIPKEDIGKASKRILLADQLEKGRDYFIVITTPGGLYRYSIDDIIRVDGFFNKTPVIEFVQKGLYATSIAGEKLYEAQVNSALNKVLEKERYFITFFSAVAQMGGTPRYALLAEFEQEPTQEEKKRFLSSMEKALREENREYDYVRNAQLLGPPILKVVKAGSYEKYKAKRLREGAHDGQFKVPELTGDANFEKNFDIAEVVTL